jgi:hypothetical protein
MISGLPYRSRASSKASRQKWASMVVETFQDITRREKQSTTAAGPKIGKHEVYGFGPEVTLPLASKSKLYGFANLRYFWETDAKSTLEGETLLLTITLPIPSIPL